MGIYEHLALELSTSRDKIRQIARTAPLRYKIYKIPKKTYGERTIAHPSRILKSCQRSLSVFFESTLPIHDSAHAYKKGSCIRKNALAHRDSKYLLKMDFLNFFHSIRPNIFFQKLDSIGFEYTKEDRYLLHKILFWSPSKQLDGKLVLSIGAPSSPLISNFVMYDFDCALHEVCKTQEITYTRYADDITLSTSKRNVLFGLPRIVRSLLKVHTLGNVSINERKTVFSSKAHNRHITGVTLANSGKISIGRDRKRLISSMLHHFQRGSLPAEDIRTLQGLLAFAFDVEPGFKDTVSKKYSSGVVKSALKGEK